LTGEKVFAYKWGEKWGVISHSKVAHTPFTGQRADVFCAFFSFQ
jgi:hypothetical protein